MSEKSISIKQIEPYWFQSVLIRYISNTLFVLSLLFFVISILTHGNYTLFAMCMMIIAVLNIIFNKLNKFHSSSSFLILSSSILIIIQTISVKSAYLMTVLVIILILSSILLDLKFTFILFVAYIITIFILIGCGILTINQQIDESTNIALVNNVTVLLPVLILGFTISLIIHKVLIGTIQTQRETQDLLIKQEKLASIQVLAGGIAHDFNNLLTGILGNIDLIASSKDINGENQEFLDEAKKATMKARNLTNQLLTFSKAGDPISKIVPSIQKIIEETTKFTLRGRHSKYELKIAPDIWAIIGDEIQIALVLQNLVLNADESMPHGGVIRIKAQNHEISSENEMQHELQQGKYVKISVEDSGVGIPESNLNKIFDPYFTTKSQGTGLGLAICYSIMKKHKGAIQIQSKEQVGTTVDIYFPATSDYSKEIETPPLVKEMFSGRILIFEDKSYVRFVLQNMLQKLGFSVETIDYSQMFLQKFYQSYEKDQKYNLIILDLTIPGDIGGEDIIKEIRKKDLSIKVIVSSGYSNNPVMNNYKQYGFDGILRKPYEFEELYNSLKWVLN